MNNILSSREIATLFWILIVVAFIFYKEKIRKSAMRVIKAVCAKKIAIPAIIIMICGSIFAYLFSLSSLWKTLFIKDIFIWVIISGIPICFNAASDKIDEGYFKHIIIDNFKVIVVVQFLLNTFTFHIIIELLIIPIVFILFMMEAYTEKKDEYKKVYQLTSWIIAILGFYIMGFTIRKAFIEYKELEAIDTFISFFIPIILSIIYVPISYLFAIWVKYDTIFIRMSTKQPKDKEILNKRHWKVIKKCGLSYLKVAHFERECIKELYVKMSEEEFDEVLSF